MSDTSRDTQLDDSSAEGHAETLHSNATTRKLDRDLETGRMVGEYRIEGRLGQGGMGTVYGAVHPLIGKRAAVKVLRPELCTSNDAVERFVLEARAVNQIGHPNIVDVFSFGELPDGRSYFVMEWLKGESLGQRLRRHRMSLAEACDVTLEVVRGLLAAHDKKIIHRDLKPDNVFLVEVPGEEQHVKLLDFGIAKLGGDDVGRMERTRSGALIGTPAYIAPEQARGYAIDHRADVYSLGVMMFEMFTGTAPFQADNAADMIAKHLHEDPPRASTRAPVPREIDDLIAAMLDKEADGRPSLQKVREVCDGVRTAFPAKAELMGTVPDAALPPAVRTSRRRRGVVLVLAGVVVAAGAAVGGVMMMGSSGSKPEKLPTPEVAPAVKPPEPEPKPEPPKAEIKPPEPEVKATAPAVEKKKSTSRKKKVEDKKDPKTDTPIELKPPPPPRDDDDDDVVDPYSKKKPQ